MHRLYMNQCGGAMVKAWDAELKDVSSPPVCALFLSSHGVSSIKLRTLENFMFYLHNTCMELKPTGHIESLLQHPLYRT
jgi:hypothetical protein